MQSATLVPSLLGQATSAPEAAIQADVVYGHKHGLAMTFDYYRPEEPAHGAGILFMVSGGWFSRWAPPEQSKPLFQAYLDLGYAVFAVRYVRLKAESFGVDPDRLGVLGMSAGGHLSLMLGTTGDDGDPSASDPVNRTGSRVAAVAALVPPTDLRVAVWSAPESLPAYRNFPALDLDLDQAGRHSPLVHVTADDAPALVIMGGKDQLVPPKHGTWIAECFQREGVTHQLIILPEADHGLDLNQPGSKTIAQVVQWFNSHLRK